MVYALSPSKHMNKYITCGIKKNFQQHYWNQLTFTKTNIASDKIYTIILTKILNFVKEVKIS